MQVLEPGRSSWVVHKAHTTAPWLWGALAQLDAHPALPREGNDTQPLPPEMAWLLLLTLTNSETHTVQQPQTTDLTYEIRPPFCDPQCPVPKALNLCSPDYNPSQAQAKET